MRVEGEERVGVPLGQAFAGLLDPAVLRACMPGLVRLEETAPGHFEGTLELKLPAVSGRFEGTVDVVEKEAPARVKLRLKGKGAPGFVDGSAEALLREEAGATAVRYVADVTVGGQFARLGQRMISGVAKEMAGQFFEAFERAEIAASTPAAAGPDAAPAALPAAPSALRAGLQLLWRLLLRALGLSKRA